MNSSANSNLEGQTMMCRIHDNKIIAVNIDSSITGVVTHLCYKCLIDNTNNNKILTIVKAKEQIASQKKQKQEKRKNEIEIILTQLQNLFQNIQQFKCKVDTVLEKISNELSKQTKLKQQELLLSENCLTQNNFWEDVQLLSEFISKQEEQIEIQYMNEMQIQFQQISVDIDYLSTIEAFNNAIKIITKINIDNQIQLECPKIENNTKTISLSTLCQDHQKEVILIDIDSENIQPEKRLACAQCMRNGTSQKYQTIEEINDLWNKKKQKVQQDIIANQQKSKKQIKQKKLNELIASISRNYYQQLNLITQAKFFQPNTQTGETSKFKQTTIQQLSYEELLSNINDLVQQDKETGNLDEHMITKDIENKLEKIKQDFQLDIQKSINYLNDQQTDSQLLEIKEQIQKIQARSILKQEEQIRIQELDELISSSKQLYCQMELLNQTKNQFQEHMKKLNSIKKQIAVFQNHQDVTNISQALDEYVYKFEKNFQNLKKYCGMDEMIESCQSEINKLENSMKNQIETKEALIKNLEQKLDILNLKPILLSNDYWTKIFYFLQEKSKKMIKSSALIFQGTKNGLNGQSFWKEVDNKDNLLMIFQSKSDYIFGAYSPCMWVSNLNSYVQDDTLSSFIFSQTHNQIYPLKQDRKQYAIYCNSNHGPTFGDGHDFYINVNFSDGYCKLGHSYQFDQYKNQSEDPHLFGQNKPQIKECEIYQIQFI